VKDRNSRTHHLDRYGLISVTEVIENGWKVERNETMVALTKDNKALIFDMKIVALRCA
jgi:hypothetical protein